MKTLVEKKNFNYCSETLTFNGHKFKIVAENGNSYSRLNIYYYTTSGELALVATKEDIPDYEYMDYIDSKEERLNGCLKNLKVAKAYIKKVWGE